MTGSQGETRFAKNGDIQIGYRVFGDGPQTVVLVPIWSSNIDLLETYPPIGRALEKFAESARVVAYDRRGSGVSDRLGGLATLEEGMDDLHAVLDDAGIDRAALFGLNEAGSLCAMYAATHPDRVTAMILYGSFATTVRQDDYPWAPTIEEREAQIEVILQLWGTEYAALGVNPSTATDMEFAQWVARWQRNSVSRDALRDAYGVLARTDVRHVLPTIRVPTLILHRVGDEVVPVANGRYLAEKIPGAKYVELPGTDHIPFLGDWQAVEDEVAEFLTGERPHRETDRVLATILLTDIVDSSKKAAELGDARWKELLDRHDEAGRAELERFQGKLVKTVGDGLLATFDGPARAIRCACRLRDRCHISVCRRGRGSTPGRSTCEVTTSGA